MSQIELFDYSVLAPDLQVEVKTATERIKLRMKRTAEDIIEIGKDLIAVKEKLPHGRFLPWIASEFEMEERTARRFMNVAERFPEIGHFDRFKPATLYELAAPSTPDEVVEQVIEKAENGETVTAKEVKALKAELAQSKAALSQKELAIANLNQANQDASKRLEDATEMLEKANEKVASEAHRIAAEKAQQIESEYQTKIAKLEQEKASADQAKQKAKEDYEKALEKFKNNPDPEVKKKLDELQTQYRQMQVDVQQATFKLQNLKEKEDQAFSASFELERFFGNFNKLIANHPDAITAMGSRYLTENSLTKLDSLANTLEYWAETIRKSIADSRSTSATQIEAVEVEIVDDEDDF